MNDFVHLHVHTVYSLLDGLNFIKPLVKRAKEMGMTSLAITDHGRLSGALEFWLACKKEGIRPIIGCEVYLAHNTGQDPSGPNNPTDHLLLLCQNQVGYRNLCKMLTIAEKPPYFSAKPRIDLELLSRFSEGLIASSACVLGPIGRHLTNPRIYDRSKKEYFNIPPDFDKAVQYAGILKEIFQGRFFVEVMNHTTDEQDLIHMPQACCESYETAMRMEKAVLDNARRVAVAAGTPWVATNDCHFLTSETHLAHDALVQVNTKRGTSKKRLRSGLNQLYLKSKEEMWKLFGHYPELLTNTCLIAEQCEVEFETGKFRIPKFNCIEIGLPDNPKIAMRELAMKGAAVRYGDGVDSNSIPDHVAERLNFEVETIAKIGVCDYMLIVADFMRFARDQGIHVGPARGSAGGSVVSYCLGITDLDPIRHGLIFERFMNPDRISMPDIDCDFPPARIQEVIDYVVEKYGVDKVARIATFQSLESKAAIQRVAQDVYEHDRQETFTLTKSLPDKQGEFGASLKEMREGHKDLLEWVSKDAKERNEILDICEQIAGVKQAASSHAAGVLISDLPLEHYLPLMVGSSERKAKKFDAMMHTQMPMDDLEEIGLLKMDFLSVDYLGSMEQCVEYIKQTQGIDFRFPAERDEPYDDPAVFELVQQGRTAGVFQIESDGMRRICMQLQPETFEQLYSVIAIHRPGPMDMVDEETGMTMEAVYIQRKRGWQPATYPMPEIEDILKPTFGVLVYQEQIIRIAQAVCGFTGSQADYLRKGVGKKKPEIVAKEKEKFIPAAVARGHDQEVVQRLWNVIETFARYGFNKSHSVGYGKLTYQTAYLKAHFRLEWMAALLTIKADNEKQVRKYVDECARLGIEILEPHINLSGAGWVPEGDAIRFGFRSIMGIDAAAEKLIAIRDNSPSKKFDDFMHMVDSCHAARFKQSDLETLIRAGACDHWGRRLTMLNSLAERWKTKEKRKKKKEQTFSLFEESIDGLEEGQDFREEDRQAEHLRLLSGCYAVDLPRGGDDALKFVVTVSDQPEAVRATEIAQRHRGNTPFILGLPTQTGATMWLQVGKVRNTEMFRKELQKHGIAKGTTSGEAQPA